MNIQVITDSTADIPQETSDNFNIKIVPVYVHFGDKTYLDGVDISSAQFYSMLTSSPVHPRTSQPSPGDFARVYRKCTEHADGIVSIHISSKISGTYNSAMVARETLNSPCPVEVIDSKFNSAGLSLVVIAAAQAAQRDAGIDEVIDEAQKAIRSSRMFGMFSTMKYLARGGRINKAIAAASEFLHVMPLLTFKDGDICRAGLVRTVEKGKDKIYDFVKGNVPVAELTIVHSEIKDHAVQLKQRLSEFIAEEKITIADLGAGLGVHGGPGVLVMALRHMEAV